MYLHAEAKLGLAGRLALVGAIEGGLSVNAAAAAFSVTPAPQTRRVAVAATCEREETSPARVVFIRLAGVFIHSRTGWRDGRSRIRRIRERPTSAGGERAAPRQPASWNVDRCLSTRTSSGPRNATVLRAPPRQPRRAILSLREAPARRSERALPPLAALPRRRPQRFRLRSCVPSPRRCGSQPRARRRCGNPRPGLGRAQ
jgi:hypothetical protein